MYILDGRMLRFLGEEKQTCIFCIHNMGNSGCSAFVTGLSSDRRPHPRRIIKMVYKNKNEKKVEKDENLKKKPTNKYKQFS